MPAATADHSLGLIRRSPLEREFERLYQRYVADVYRYAVYILRDAAEAEDATQAAFLNAFRAFQRGERPRKPRSWLLTIVHNECRRVFRTKARRPSEVELDEGLTADAPPDDDVPTPEEIRRALGQLSFNQRSALVMRELEGRSYTEIARTLELSVSAVETLLFRARRAMREQLEGALTCGEAELALSKQLDGRLAAEDKAGLRAHLRACKECSRLARRQRAQRAALRSLGPAPLPGSLTSLFGGGGGGGGLLAGGSALGGGVALKAAALLAGGAVATGVGLGTALAGGGPASSAAELDPVRQGAAAPARTESAPLAQRSRSAILAAEHVALGGIGTRFFGEETGAAGGGDQAPGGARNGAGAGDAGRAGGDGAAPRGETTSRPRLLPRSAPVALPKVSVPAPQVTVPAVPVPRPEVRVPRPAKPAKPAKPAVELPKAPTVTVPAPPKPPAVQPPPVPPVQPPLPPPPPKLP